MSKKHNKETTKSNNLTQENENDVKIQDDFFFSFPSLSNTPFGLNLRKNQNLIRNWEPTIQNSSQQGNTHEMKSKLQSLCSAAEKITKKKPKNEKKRIQNKKISNFFKPGIKTKERWEISQSFLCDSYPFSATKRTEITTR